MRESSSDKQWAKAYILDPLTAPEPSQETGVSSSHNLAAQFKRNNLSSSSASSSSSSIKGTKNRSPKPTQTPQQRSYPTPPTSASPSRADFHPSNPFSAAGESSKSTSPPRSPPRSPPNSAHNPRRYPPNTAVTRSSSARVPQLVAPSKPQHHRSFSTGTCDLSRNPSITQRFPGDMTHRPLEILRKEARAADRAPHLRRKNIPHTDTIDALDTIGGTYHHGGPFDAALASRNRQEKYSPAAAVHDSNMEAIRATPREYIEDSLRRNKPLQGIAIIPSGQEDFRGNVMQYKEGADLMRERDAAGGAYKRYEDIEYHPDDLKGKGANFELERDLKAKKRLAKGQVAEYEMLPRRHETSRPTPSRHHRSFSDLPVSTPANGFSNSTDLGGQPSTGKRLSDGFRRRFGSIRRKKQEV
ncbi:hypothetical protein EDB81DRAFT_880957 [Dactylonectria macrodidyma]|uniref:Pal1 cell morphology protein n=1 Tax=Dactylonectria macrodidyma TaxID=307937 RepID=A0A9P9JFZ9_9HYPO|nr:hypothetical protein EDB81DRAFT_880957 [Dactylonectria macrodidyma]